MCREALACASKDAGALLAALCKIEEQALELLSGCEVNGHPVGALARIARARADKPCTLRRLQQVECRILAPVGRRMVQPAERADRNFLALFAKPDGEDDGKMWIDRLFDPLGMYRCVPSLEYQRAVKLTPRRVG